MKLYQKESKVLNEIQDISYEKDNEDEKEIVTLFFFLIFYKLIF